MVHQWWCLSGNAPEMCHLWSMKPKQIFDMSHFRETTQQFSRFKSSPSDVGVQKLQQWAPANSIFLPSRQFWCLPPLPTPHFTFRITRPNHTFACSSIREESRIAFCQTWTSSLFAISASFWLSKLDHKQHFWARLVSQNFSNHILQPNCRGRTTKCVGGWGGRFFSLGIVWNILVGYPPILLMHCWKYCNVSRMLKTYWNVQVVVEQPHKTQLQLAVPPSNVN